MTMPHPSPLLYVNGDGGADPPSLGQETAIQLGSPANLILKPEQLPYIRTTHRKVRSTVHFGPPEKTRTGHQ